jgi:antitoxin component YwqK of YwqJK toxin-antitoxin module
VEYDNREGLKQGLLKAYHHNGVLARESTYEDDYLTGVNRLYDSTGVLREELSYKTHLTPLDISRLNHGITKVLNEAMDRYQFDRGVLSGAHKIYHENGKLQSEEYLFDNLPDSIAREYYDNGQLKSEIFYDSDFEQARRYEKTFARNGKLVKSINHAKRKPGALESEPDTVSSFLEDALAPDKP